MTVEEYNKLYKKVGTCKCVMDNLDEILKDGDIARLQSLVPKDFAQIINNALNIYLILSKLEIN